MAEFWEELLQQCSKRPRQGEDGAVFVLGDKGAGKSSLLSCFCERQSIHSAQDLLAYDYFLASESEDLESVSRISVWSLNEVNSALYGADVLKFAKGKHERVSDRHDSYSCLTPSLPPSLPPSLSRWLCRL
jgi:septin family protein